VPFMPTELQLGTWISAERLSKYVAAPEDSVALYEWNAALNGAFYELIGHAEILLRNVFHSQLARYSVNGAWYDDPFYPFNDAARREIRMAKRGASRGGRLATPGRVVAELNFGFWRYLLTTLYQSTIWPRLQSGFRGIPRHERNRSHREVVVSNVHLLRNRVAHYEPIFHTNIAQHLADITEIARYVDLEAQHWLWRISRVDELMESRPTV
jgi:hypothetical protein